MFRAFRPDGRHRARDVELAFNQGQDDYLKKPIDAEELAFRINELLASPKWNRH